MTRQSLGPMLREQSRLPSRTALGVRFLVARKCHRGWAEANVETGGWWWCRPTLSAVSPVPLGFKGRRGPPLVRLGVENTIDASRISVDLLGDGERRWILVAKFQRATWLGISKFSGRKLWRRMEFHPGKNGVKWNFWWNGDEGEGEGV